MKKGSLVLGAAALCVCLLPGIATAQSTNKAAADALFNEGKRLMGEGKFAEACPKFKDSQAADPAVGTQLNLARCYKKAGLTASAWSEYRSAAAAARTAGQSKREEFCEEYRNGLGAASRSLSASRRMSRGSP